MFADGFWQYSLILEVRSGLETKRLRRGFGLKLATSRKPSKNPSVADVRTSVYKRDVAPRSCKECVCEKREREEREERESERERREKREKRDKV